ncbi:MAG: hypothetical protein ABW139_02785 [Candidatus Thiodiazotropha sp. DIVDIV]
MMIHNKKITLSFIVLIKVFLSVNVFASEKLEIQWELDNPFRFFTNPKITSDIRKHYISIINENNKGLSLERKLQDEWFTYDENGDKQRFPTSGWAASIASDNYKDTCWNTRTNLYNLDNKLCENYINPKSHLINVWLNGGVKGDSCKWSYNLKNKSIEIKEVDCTKPIPIDVPYEGTVGSLYVNVSVNRNPSLTEKIEIKDIFVVGLGDSYGSGEGNPDIPVTFYNQRDNEDRLVVNNVILPRKDYINEKKKYMSATWMDRRCHRSLYSYQFKTALQLALDNPKQAVTFISFSCTGATTDNILSKPKSAAEYFNPIQPEYVSDTSKSPDAYHKLVDRKISVLPQLELLDMTLGKSARKIDILLLSTGGNDIGFAYYVLNVAAKNRFLRLPVKVPTQDTINDVYSIIDNNYRSFDKAIRKYLKNSDSKRIFLTAYPNILRDEHGKLCEGDNEIFDIPFGSIQHRKQRIRNTETNLLIPFYEIQKKTAHDLDWHLVDKHRDLYLKHGFCSKDHGLIGNEQFIIPHKNNITDDWYPDFSQHTYRAYRKKQRWIQIPVDSVLMINRTQRTWLGDFDLFFSDETSGIMHPSADGLSTTANANVEAIINSDIYDEL